MIALSTTSEKKTFIEHGCNVFCWPSKKNKCLSYNEKKKSLTCCTTCVADNGKILWLRRLLEEKKKRIYHAPQSSLQKSYRAEQNSSLADRHEHFLPTGKYST